MTSIPFFALLSFADVVVGSTFFKLVNTSDSIETTQEVELNERLGIPQMGACALMAHRDQAPSFIYSVSSQFCLTLKKPFYTSTDNSTLDFTKEFLNYNAYELPPEAESTYKDTRYQMFTDPKTWEEAGKRCQEVGGNLVDITSAEEQKFIEEFLVSNNARNVQYWIGANDLEEEKNFVWSVNNQPLNYTNWDYGEPDNAFSGQHCSVLKSKKSNGQRPWNDRKCSNKFPFVCKI